MLGKLMKHELRATGRILFPLYLLILVASVGFAISFRTSEFYDSTTHQPFAILGAIFSLLLLAAVLIAVIMTVVLILQRFYKNLLGHEGYLMFSLPVSTAEHIACKSLTALLWVILSLVLGGLCAFLVSSILGDFGGMMGSVKVYWNSFVTSENKEVIIRTSVLGLILFVAQTLKQIGQVYAAIAIGHQWTDHRILGSFLAYIGLSIAEGFLGSFLGQARHLADTVLENAEAINGATPVLILVIIAELVLVLAYNLLTWFLLDRRLNLE